MTVSYNYCRTVAVIVNRTLTTVMIHRLSYYCSAVMIYFAIYRSSNRFMIYYWPCSYPGINYYLCFCGAEAANGYKGDYCDFEYFHGVYHFVYHMDSK